MFSQQYLAENLMWGFKIEGGIDGPVEGGKKGNNDYNVVILFMRGVPALIPPDA